MFSLASEKNVVSVLSLLLPDHVLGIPTVAEANYDRAFANIQKRELDKIGKS